MKFGMPALLTAAPLFLLLHAGCSKQSGEAVVLEKEYIAAGEEEATPTPGITPADPAVTATSTPQADESATRPMADDEIDVEGYVMKKEVRGTTKDPRAYPGLEQWRLTVQMVAGGRTFVVRAPKAQFEKLKPGDRVTVRYREGKYTGAVWSAELVD